MSYILSPAGTLSVPVAIAQGGTGSTTATAAATAIVDGATGKTSIATLAQFGDIAVGTSPAPDPAANQTAINELLSALGAMGVVQVV